MSKLNKIKNGEYIGGDKYTITPDAGGKSRVVFSPDNILTEPTPVGAEILNEMQLNQVYTLDTTRSVDGQKEVYIATLEGFTEFDSPDLSFNLKINSENTNSQTYLRLNGIDYLIECKIGNLKAGSIVYAKKVNSVIKVIGNKNFGVVEGDILEGHRMAQIQGVEKFGGDVQTAGTKKVGYAYWCTVNKDMYICKVENSLNYIDASYFEAFSNNALLGKLNNLIIKEYSCSISPEFDFFYMFDVFSIGKCLFCHIHINTTNKKEIPAGAIFLKIEGISLKNRAYSTTSSLKTVRIETNGSCFANDSSFKEEQFDIMFVSYLI